MNQPKTPLEHEIALEVLRNLFAMAGVAGGMNAERAFVEAERAMQCSRLPALLTKLKDQKQ